VYLCVCVHGRGEGEWEPPPIKSFCFFIPFVLSQQSAAAADDNNNNTVNTSRYIKSYVQYAMPHTATAAVATCS